MITYINWGKQSAWWSLVNFLTSKRTNFIFFNLATEQNFLSPVSLSVFSAPTLFEAFLQCHFLSPVSLSLFASSSFLGVRFHWISLHLFFYSGKPAKARPRWQTERHVSFSLACVLLLPTKWRNGARQGGARSTLHRGVVAFVPKVSAVRTTTK